jgi:nitrilase
MNQKNTNFRAAAVQMAPVLFDREATTEKVIKAIERCGKEQVRLAVFPETIIPNYPYFAMVNPPVLIAPFFKKLYDQAVDVPGPVTEKISRAAGKSGVVVVLGVNERDGGSLYNTQVIFDADGSILGKRRKIMPTFQERMIWGRGDGSGLTVYKSAVGRIGALICWEHYMPLARYALIAKGEEIHCSHFPGAITRMSKQIDAAIRHHAMEAGAFVVNATAWLSQKQTAEICPDESIRSTLQGGLCTAIVSPHGHYLAGPLPEGEDMAIAEIDLEMITSRKNMLDTAGHYARPDILKLQIDSSPKPVMEEMPAGFEEILKDEE